MPSGSGFPPTGERGKPATEEAGSCWDLLAAGNHGQRGGLLGPTHRDAGARETEGGCFCCSGCSSMRMRTEDGD